MAALRNLRIQSNFKQILVFSLFIAGVFENRSARADEPLHADERYVISVLIMGSNEELFARFGHIALVVEDRESGKKRVYNFGTFNFNDPDLQLKYARGFLNYWLSIESYRHTIFVYEIFDRELVERTLNLSPRQAEQVAKRLKINALPENRTYAYRHYLDNCCTRIRDILDDVTNGAISQGRDKHPTGQTFRHFTREALRGMPIMSTLILFSLGPAVDRPITRSDEEFLPKILGEDLDDTHLGPDQKPLVKSKQTLVHRKGPEVGQQIPILDIAIAALLLVLVVIGLVLPAGLGNRLGQARLLGLGLFVWGLVAGIGGLALLLYWTATTHYDTHYNENLFSYLPSHLWLLGPGIKLVLKGKIKTRTIQILKWYLLISIGFIILDLLLKIGPFIQDNYGFVAFAALCNIAALAGVIRVFGVKIWKGRV